MQIVAASLNFCQQLLSLFFLISLQSLPLLVCVLLTKLFHALCLRNFQLAKLIAVVDSFFNSLIDSDQLLVVLHLAQLGSWLDFGCFDGAAQLLVQQVHLVIMLLFEFVDFSHVLVFLFLEIFLPLHIEFLESLLTYLNVVLELTLLNVGA